MRPAWPDWMVLGALLLTLTVVFALVFSQKPLHPDGPPLQWRSPAPQRGDSLRI
ncbi:MAG: hypothetical protein VKK03_08195 [Synechococcus sp.]|nr:hypothetical protein [Synechococcus sp.]